MIVKWTNEQSEEQQTEVTHKVIPLKFHPHQAVGTATVYLTVLTV